MPNYSLTAVSATEVQRWHQFTFVRPMEGALSMVFAEERVLNVDGTLTITRLPGMQFPLDNTPFNLYGAGGVLTGTTMTPSELFMAIESLYKQRAAVRDAGG